MDRRWEEEETWQRKMYCACVSVIFIYFSSFCSLSLSTENRVSFHAAPSTWPHLSFRNKNKTPSAAAGSALLPTCLEPTARPLNSFSFKTPLGTIGFSILFLHFCYCCCCVHIIHTHAFKMFKYISGSNWCGLIKSLLLNRTRKMHSTRKLNDEKPHQLFFF